MEIKENPNLSNSVPQCSSYEQLCQAANVTPFNHEIMLSQFVQTTDLASKEVNERLAAALHTLLSLTLEQNFTPKRVDKAMIDRLIAYIDEKISLQLDEILHHPDFQALESLWRGVQYVVDHTDISANAKIELLDVDKETLQEDFEEVAETSQSGLFKHIYEREYDTPGGEPFTAIISPFEFDSSSQDIALLRDLSKIAAVAHCPFIGSVGHAFFNKSSMEEVVAIEDLTTYMERTEYIRWNSFRESEDARYIGLTMPRFLLRLPYGEDNPVKSFSYQESVADSQERYLWGAAGFAFASNLSKSFKTHGWCVNIRGPEAGGKVENLPLHQYDAGRGLQTKIPSEVMIAETRELSFANLGFIPLSYYKNSDYACFFSANSCQKPASYYDKKASTNSKINARLPYLFLSSRIAHYLKVLQREAIGSSISSSELEEKLNLWLSTLVTKMNNPGPELAATHPLREGNVIVEPIDGNPGYFRINLHAVPHFQVEGMDVKLSLVGQLPT